MRIRAVIPIAIGVALLAPPAVAGPPSHARNRAPRHDRGKHKGHDKDKHHGKGHHHVRRKAPPARDHGWHVRKQPVVKKYDPHQGPPGTHVELRGRHFDSDTRILLNGQALRIVSLKRNRVEVVVPRRAQTDRFVVSKRGFRDTPIEPPFQVVRPPKISRFRPGRGNPGIDVTLRGANFLDSDEFRLGKVKLGVKSVLPKRAIVHLPAGAKTGRFFIVRGGHRVAQSRRMFQVALPPPVITKVDPLSGPPGERVRIYGTNFDNADRVRIGPQRLKVVKRDPAFIEVVIGRNRSGHLFVYGASGHRTGKSKKPFVVIRPPVVRRFAPTAGGPGTRIRVYGASFNPGDAVYLGKRQLAIRKLSDRMIVAELPAGVDSGKISVRRGDKSYPARGGFTVLHAPKVASLQPKQGPPGETVMVSGEHFMPRSRVLLSGRKLRIVKRKPPHDLWVKIPRGARTGRMVVVTPAGSARSKDNFTVTAYSRVKTFFPLKGVPGTKVRVDGANFQYVTAVLLGKHQVKQTQVTPNRLYFVVPDKASSGRISVKSFGKRVASRLPFKVLPPPPEVSFTVAPAHGPRGSEVALTLSPPRQEVTVFFNGRPLPKKVYQRGKRIVVTVPADAHTGYFEVEYNNRRYRAPKKFRVR